MLYIVKSKDTNDYIKNFRATCTSLLLLIQSSNYKLVLTTYSRRMIVLWLTHPEQSATSNRVNQSYADTRRMI